MCSVCSRMALQLVIIACMLVFLATSSVLAAVAAAGNSRMLLQTRASCPAQIPACRRCSTKLIDSVETHVCMRCLCGYVGAMSDDGKSFLQCGASPAVAGKRGTTHGVLHEQRFWCFWLLMQPRQHVILPGSHSLIQIMHWSVHAHSEAHYRGFSQPCLHAQPSLE
jgi:hypothetical protein